MLYPWQEEDLSGLIKIADNGCSALLIKGKIGDGVDALINEYAKLLLCENSKSLNNAASTLACNTCQSCRLFDLGNNPDYYYLNIAEDQKAISIAQVRGMIDFLSLSPNLSKYKVVVIPELTLLNQSSANALLKIVEEPPLYVRFIFFTSNISLVLPTLKSRCLIYSLQSVKQELVASYVAERDISSQYKLFWLNYYDNLPLFMPEITDEQLKLFVTTLSKPSIDNIFLTTTEFDGKKAPVAITLDLLDKWLQDIACIKLGANIKYFGGNYSSECESTMIKLAEKIKMIDSVFILHDQINFLYKWATHPLNYKLQFENLLFQYQKLFVESKV